MILANATIYTADPARPFAAAMAVRGGRVLRVGTYDSVKVCCSRTCCSPFHQRLPTIIFLPVFNFSKLPAASLQLQAKFSVTCISLKILVRDVQELKGRYTYELNLSGNVVLPGFIDSHVHLIDGGLQVVLHICLSLQMTSHPVKLFR
jgi:hypothetical protein